MHTKLLVSALLLAVALTGLPGLTPAARATPLDSRLQALLAEAGTQEPLSVIVTFRGEVEPAGLPVGPRSVRRAELVRSLKSRAATSQSATRQFLRERGVVEIRDLWAINGLAVDVPAATLRELAARPEVLRIQYDEVVTLPDIEPAQVTGPAEANIELVKARALWDLGFAGQGVTVAIMDSGVDPNHPDLGPRWRGGSNSWFDPHGEHPLVPFDADGHGTSMMGVILGGNAGGSYIGVAPEARWVAVKIFNDAGSARISHIQQGFGWLLDPDGNPATDDAPDVVNNSWDFSATVNQCISDLEAGLQLLKQAGIAVVFAGGNAGPGASTSVSPANNPAAFAVGSVGTQSSATTVSEFSSRGPSACDGTTYPEMVAPGFAVRTADLTSGGASPGNYVEVFGTSVATPHVAGVMALLLSAFPEMSPVTLESALKMSALDLGSAGADNSYGFGLVDAQAAFALLNDALLSLIDPVEPVNDGILPYGHLPVGSTSTRTIRLQNDGLGFLFIEAVRIVGSPSFAITANNCGQLLASGQSCLVSVRFAPTVHQGFAASLEVASNGSVSGLSAVTLSGTGNTLPPAPLPLAPDNGASGLNATVELQWQQSPDADGDLLSHEVRFSTSPDFSQSPPIEVSHVNAAGSQTLLAGGLLLLFGVAAGRRQRIRQLLLHLLLLAALLLLFSCGGGGGGDGGDEVDPAVSQTLIGLAPATTYYWQVTAVDSLGGRTESPVWSFTTL